MNELIIAYDHLKREIEEALAKSGLPFCVIADMLHLYWLRADMLAAQELAERKKNGSGKIERKPDVAAR